MEELDEVLAGVDMFISENYREDAKSIIRLATESDIRVLLSYKNDEEPSYFIFKIDSIKLSLVKHGILTEETYPKFGEI